MGEGYLLTTCSEDQTIIVTDIRSAKPVVSLKEFQDGGENTFLLSKVFICLIRGHNFIPMEFFIQSPCYCFKR